MASRPATPNAPKQQKFNVCVSFAGADGKFAAENIVDALAGPLGEHNCGISWSNEFVAGENWVDGIHAMLKKSKVCILLLTSSSHDSKWQLFEYQTFKKKLKSSASNGSVIIPVLVGRDPPSWLDAEIHHNNNPLSSVAPGEAADFLVELYGRLCEIFKFKSTDRTFMPREYKFVDGVKYSPAGSAPFSKFLEEINIAAQSYKRPGQAKVFNIEFQTFRVPAFWAYIINKSSLLQIALPDRKFSQLEQEFFANPETLYEFLGLSKIKKQLADRPQLLARLIKALREGSVLCDESGRKLYCDDHQGDDRFEFRHATPNIRFYPYIEDAQDVSTAYSLFTPAEGDGGPNITYVFPKALPFAEYDQEASRWKLLMFGKGTSQESYNKLDSHFKGKLDFGVSFSALDLAVLVSRAHPDKERVGSVLPELKIEVSSLTATVCKVDALLGERDSLLTSLVKIMHEDREMANIFLSRAHTSRSVKNLVGLHAGTSASARWPNALLWIGPWSFASKWIRATANDFDKKISKYYSIYHLDFASPSTQCTSVSESIICAALAKLQKRYDQVSVIATSVNGYAALSAVHKYAASGSNHVSKVVLLSPAIDLFENLESFSRSQALNVGSSISKIRKYYCGRKIEADNPLAVNPMAALYFMRNASEHHLLDFIYRGKYKCDISHFESCLNSVSSATRVAVCYNTADEMVDYVKFIKSNSNRRDLSLFEYSWYHSLGMNTFISQIQGKPDVFEIGISQVHEFLVNGVDECPYLNDTAPQSP